MSSGFPDGTTVPGFYSGGRIINGRRSTPMMHNNNPQVLYNSPFLDSRMFHRGNNLIGKRSYTDLQQRPYFFQQQQMALNSLRNVKPRLNYQQNSPISPLSPTGDFSSLSSVTNNSNLISRYGYQNFHQFKPQQQQMINRNVIPPVNNFSIPNLVQIQMKNRLQELEKQLLDDDDDDDENEDNAVSAIINSEWSETIQNLDLIPGGNQKPIISPSPNSPSTPSSDDSVSSLVITSPKQSISDAATAIVDGKKEVALEILTRLSKIANINGTSEQRLTAYMTSALKSRLNPSENSPPVSELYSENHNLSTQMLYDVSPCFKLGFMAANLAILESISDETVKKLHIIDFDIGKGCQYVHLLHGLAANKSDSPPVLKISAYINQFINGEEDRLKVIGDGLNVLSNKIGVTLIFTAISLNVSELSRENLQVEDDEALVVNLAFKLYKLPDESVTTENQRDELLRRVKGLSPKVVTVVEQEKNANTAAFVARVKEEWEYNGALLDSLDETLSKESSDRVKIEEGLSRRMCNSVACEGGARQERCELFGKWRARMSMAGFQPRLMSSFVADSLRSKLNSVTRGNQGFSVKEECGGICLGWKGRSIAVASAWL